MWGISVGEGIICHGSQEGSISVNNIYTMINIGKVGIGKKDEFLGTNRKKKEEQSED